MRTDTVPADLAAMSTTEQPPETLAPAAARSDRDAFASIDWMLFTAIGLIWGASFLFIAIGLDHFHPGLVTWARVGLGAAALAALPAARGRIDREDRARLTLLSVVWVGVPFTLFPLAEEHINSAVTGVLNGATPFFAGLIGGLFFDRVPRGPQRLGMAVGFAGIALVSLGSSSEGGTAVVGVLMVLAATLFYGFATNLAVPLSQKYGSVVVMSRMLGLATLWTAPFGLWGLAHSSFGWGAAAATTVLGVVGTGLAFALMGTLVSRVGGPRASFITYLIPVVSLALGTVFRDDHVRPLALAGVALVLTGAILASKREH
ncbi:MAG TPA: DMT family transporter [Acidimicrobiales bacterium]|nr:DMT family transporter [Acidimicrobiales bacterium]